MSLLAQALGFKRAREESTAGAPNGAGEGAKATEPKAKKPKNGKEQKREKTEELTIAGDKFKTYDLKALQVPLEAYPQTTKKHLGLHGYTLTAANGAVIWPQHCFGLEWVFKYMSIALIHIDSCPLQHVPSLLHFRLSRFC